MTRMFCRKVAALAAMMALLLLGAGDSLAEPHQIYWADIGLTGKIQRASGDGSNIEDLLLVGNPLGLALDPAEGKMYFFGTVDIGVIKRANIEIPQGETPATRTDIENVVIGQSDPHGFDLDLAAGRMYWNDVGTHDIRSATLDGFDERILVTGLGHPHGLALDVAGGKMYWTDGLTDKVQRSNLDGSNVEDLVTGLADGVGIALDVARNRMYWTDVTADKIESADLDGGNRQDVVTGLPFPFELALDLDEGRIYWTENNLHKIQSAKLDGSDIRDEVIDLDGPTDIALLFDITVTIDIKPGSDPNSINLGSAGVIPVAILSTENFDATIDLDRDTISLAGARVKMVGNSNRFLCHEDFVNADDLLDLVCQVETVQFIIEEGESIAVLEAETFGGVPIRGEDTVRIVP